MALQETSAKMLLILTSILANFVTVHCAQNHMQRTGYCYQHNGQYFWFVSQKKTYEQAKANCENRWGDLWDPHHPYLWSYENTWVYNTANYLFGQDQEYWISTDWYNDFGFGRSELERAKPTPKQCWDYTDNIQHHGRAIRTCGMSTWRNNGCKCFTEAANNYNTEVDCSSIPGSQIWDAPRASVCHLNFDCSNFWYNCNDNHNSCQYWKNKGYCTYWKYKNWMAENCKNACGKC